MEKVSVVRCASSATDAEVVQRTEETIQALGDYGRGLRGARKIAVKINAGVSRLVQRPEASAAHRRAYRGATWA